MNKKTAITQIQANGGKAAGWAGNKERFVFAGRCQNDVEAIAVLLRKNTAVCGCNVGGAMSGGRFESTITINWRKGSI